MESMLEAATAISAILMPVLLIFVIFFFGTKMEKTKFDAVVEISKGIQDPSEIRALIEELHEKKRPIDYRRSGVITLFVGIGLSLFGIFFIGDILKGAGLLVTAIGVGSIIAGYLYPNDSAEITKAVERFEEQ
jgi:hypothetical protein